MDQKEWLLLTYLRANGRMPLTTLSKKTGIPVSTLHDRLKRSAHVHKISALLDFGRMGYGAKAYILVKANRRYKDNLVMFLKGHYHVNNLHKINNGYDYMFECVFRDMKELEDFMEELDEKYKVRNTSVHYIINDLKRESFIADPQRIGELTKARAM